MTAPISSQAMISPEASAAEQSRRELQARLNGLGGIGGRKLSPEVREKKLREACEGFESIFIQKMWQEMRNAVPKGGMFHGREERFWQDMYDQELSKSMASAGGIGLADMMFEQLSRNLVSASRSAADMVVAGPAFTPSAAPLVPETARAGDEGAVKQAHAETSRAVAAIYEGAAPQAGQAEGESAARETAAGIEPVQTAPQPAAPHEARQMSNGAVAGHAVQPAKEVSRPHKRSQRHYPSGVDLAQIARREAGDKLGSRAIRPPLHEPRHSGGNEQREAPEPAEAAPRAAQRPLPGTPEALRAAVELAKSGAQPEQTSSPVALNDLVARVKAKNAADAAAEAGRVSPAQAMPAAAQAANESQPANAEPVTRTVRFTTNIPSRNRSKKKSAQAIRLLNADSVGVNSKAGQGLAAYHAAIDAAQAPDAQKREQPGQEAPAAAIAPLRASQAGGDEARENAGFAIPPLKAADLRS